MAANLDTMLYVGETPWHGLGHRYEVAPDTPEEIITGAELDWEVGALPMTTELHSKVFNYNTIYRKDNNGILGVVNKSQIYHVQNTSMFNAFGSIIGKAVTTETAAALGTGANVFGCFKIGDQYKVLDDDVDHYFVVLNEHLRCDGKITILNTPIRVVCQNTLIAAMKQNTAKIRIPVSTDQKINEAIAMKIIRSADNALVALNKRAEKLVNEKIDKKWVERLLDEVFPYIEVKEGDTSTHDRANERITMMRETFVNDCMGADNLGNYRSTKWQVANAILDFGQHWYLNVDKAYDLNYRMGAVLGSSDTTQPVGMVKKALQIVDKMTT